jgi:N-acetylneuraminate synthase
MRCAPVKIASRYVGPGHPVYVVGEIGINHNGDLNLAKKLIDVAAEAGLDAVKFQKRTPELCVPRDQWLVERDTPWGTMTYIEYRHRLEFNGAQLEQVFAHCKDCGIDGFASAWDSESVELLSQYDLPCYKVASPSLTNTNLLEALARTSKPVILSTGMSTPEQIRKAVAALDRSRLIICHTTSAYPCKPSEVNLRMIETLIGEFQVPVGYSGHEMGLAPSLAAVALGACLIERHITLDRTLWGSDQSLSLEPHEVVRLVQDIRQIELALGDGVKTIYPSEIAALEKLRLPL